MKTVLLPIKVPDGKYCWEFCGGHEICGNFDNEGGHPSCDLNFYDLKHESEKGVLKPDTCAKLQSTTEGVRIMVTDILANGKPCTCNLCERGKRFKKNVEGLPEEEQAFMMAMYNGLMELEEWDEMQRIHIETTGDTKND